MVNQETLDTFHQLYDQSYHDISKYVICQCANIEDAKDIIQNIYLEVYQCLMKKKNINQAYIKAIAKNKVKDFYRFHYKNKLITLFSQREEQSYTENIPSSIDIEKSIHIQYDNELVWNYLKKKNVIISKIFYLYYYLGLTIKEIAIELNITESNVKHYLYRSLKELNQYFERESDIHGKKRNQ